MGLLHSYMCFVADGNIPTMPYEYYETVALEPTSIAWLVVGVIMYLTVFLVPIGLAIKESI